MTWTIRRLLREEGSYLVIPVQCNTIQDEDNNTAQTATSAVPGSAPDTNAANIQSRDCLYFTKISYALDEWLMLVFEWVSFSRVYDP